MRREDRRAAAREGILAAAHRQVTEDGCASASVAAVTARAGIAAGSLYRHFGSRTDLLAEVVGDALRGEAGVVRRAMDGLPPQEALAAWVRTTTVRALQAPTLAHALHTEPVEPPVEAVRLRERAAREQALAALLEAGADAGTWPAGDLARRAAAVLGALEAALVGPGAARRLGPRPDPQAEAAALTAFVLGALRG